jgi:hypothetical protein
MYSTEGGNVYYIHGTKCADNLFPSKLIILSRNIHESQIFNQKFAQINVFNY